MKTKTKRKRKADLAKIEKELVALEQKLRREMNERLGNVQNTSRGDPSELLDMASEGELDYMSAVSAEAGSATIDEVHQAIEKLREGTYGECSGCGGRIRARRLKARPFAVLCLRCKEQQERFGYVRSSGPASPRAGTEVTVSLTDEDLEPAEASMADLFRDVEDVEIRELF
jgi:DnaK suppressor protein